jgi:type I restriction enzyme R subunit
MIGRGPRLCPDLFEPGKSKSEFLIFDFCYNFEFFGQNPKGAENRTQKSLSHRIFETRLKIAHAVYNHCKDESNFEDLKQHADGLIELLKRQVFDLNNDNFIVRQKLRTVEKYKDPHQWNNLTDMEVKEILEDLAPLVVDISSDPTAKHFDLMMLQLQLLMLIGDKRQLKIIENTRMTGAKLSKKYTIPAVAQKKEIIEKIQTKVYWEGMTVPAVDRLREEIRDLIKFIDLEAMSIVYTNFEDEINITNISVFEPGILIINDLEMYRKRIEGMIKEMLSNPVIEKLRKNIPVTKEDIASIENLILSNDELSNTQLFQRAIDGMPLGKFIRSIVGMDISAAKAEFASFIAKYKLNETQIRFIDTIVDYVVANGTITGENLFEPSFTDISDSSIVDLFEKEQIAQLMAVMERINRNALAA